MLYLKNTYKILKISLTPFIFIKKKFKKIIINIS